MSCYFYKLFPTLYKQLHPTVPQSPTMFGKDKNFVKVYYVWQEETKSGELKRGNKVGSKIGGEKKERKQN